MQQVGGGFFVSRMPTLADDVLGAFHRLFGLHRGLRPVHTRGVFLEGEFLPADPPAGLSRAAFLHGAPTPVVARFSNFVGDPDGADNAPQRRGFAVRFLLPNDASTDVIAHSYDGFPTRTAEDLVLFLRAVAEGSAAVERFRAAHPESQPFLEAPEAAPVSYATEVYFGVHAFRYVAGDGKATFGRPRFEPVAGVQHYSAEAAAALAPDYLRTELRQRLASGPVLFRYRVQIAGPGDPLDDATRRWADDRLLAELGVLRLTKLATDEDGLARRIGFLPTHLVDGIEPPSDPLFAARRDAYMAAYAERS